MIRRWPRSAVRDRLPRGLIGMLWLVGLTELFIARRGPDFSNIWFADWRQARVAARREATRADVLCFGDSLVKFGVMPRVVESRLGKRVYSLALWSGQAPASYYLLHQALEAGAHPAAVLIDGELLMDDVVPLRRHWAELLNVRDCFDLAWTAREPNLFTAVMLAKLLPTVKDRYEVRAIIAAALIGQDASKRRDITSYRRNWLFNHGGQVMPKNPTFSTDFIEKSYFPGPWSCHPLNATYVRKFLRLAADHKIPVFWLLPPINPITKVRREQAGHYASFTRFLRAEQARFSNLVVIDGWEAGYDRSVFWDATHLDRQGAYAFSIAVAGILRSALTTPETSARWARVPAYREPPSDIPIEDIMQSMMAENDRMAHRGRRR